MTKHEIDRYALVKEAAYSMWCDKTVQDMRGIPDAAEFIKAVEALVEAGKCFLHPFSGCPTMVPEHPGTWCSWCKAVAALRQVMEAQT